MAVQTKKLDLRKPVGTDTVSVDLDISGNLQKLDDAGGEKKMVRRTSGVLGITGTAWRRLPTAVDPSLDLILKANVGDWIEVGISGLWAAEAVVGILDVCSHPVAGTAVSSWAQSGGVPDPTYSGAMCWYGVSGAITAAGGSIMKQVVAGDLDAGGLLRVAPWGRAGSAGTKNLYGNPELPLEFWAKNLGQP